ncbi:ATP-dependent DNA ligase [Methanobacterium sp. VT]|uniref:ATP-dependent DNA ligase n=2 Tax=Methanobacterium spitsbergense TaxID=2874285 RepID=A0A8T5UT17_9EURY|nr:ATP-dependent DNA ligase [Methanobacterium spitsbergense]
MIEPMLATLTNPTNLKLTGTWIIEPKYDGERIIAVRYGDKIDLWTRRNIQATYKFPEIVKALKKEVDGDKWILDGEMTVKGGFRQLLNRNVEDRFKISLLSRKIPATFNIFDILQYEKDDLINRPLMERKSILMKVVHPENYIEIVPFKEVDKPDNQFQDYLKQGYEGAVIKNLDSKYEPGKRSDNWLKIKKGDTVDVCIIGATKSTSSIPFGALLMEKNGKYFGRVGTGFSDQDRKDILKLLKENQAPLQITVPPDVEPEILITSKPLLAEIKMQEMIKRSPRAPVWVRFRWE